MTTIQNIYLENEVQLMNTFKISLLLGNKRLAMLMAFSLITNLGMIDQALASSHSVLDPYADIQAPGVTVEAKTDAKTKKFTLPKLSHTNKKVEAEKKIKSSQIVRLIPVKKQTTSKMDFTQTTDSPKVAKSKVKPIKAIKNIKTQVGLNNANNTLTDPAATTTQMNKLSNNQPKLSDSLKQIKDGYVNTLKAASSSIIGGAKSISSAKPIKDMPDKLGGGSKAVAQKLSESTKSVAQKLGESTKSVAQKLGDGTKSVAQKLGDGTKTVAQKVETGVKTSSSTLGNTVKVMEDKLGSTSKLLKASTKNIGEKIGSGTESIKTSTKNVMAKIANLKPKTKTTNAPQIANNTKSLPLPRIKTEGFDSPSMPTAQGSDNLAIHQTINTAKINNKKPIWSKLTAKFNKPASPKVQTASNGQLETQ